MTKRYTHSELEGMETIHQGHFDDLKFDDGTTRVWLFRGVRGDYFPATEDDSDYPLVTVEGLIDGRWETTDTYEAI